MSIECKKKESVAGDRSFDRGVNPLQPPEGTKAKVVSFPLLSNVGSGTIKWQPLGLHKNFNSQKGPNQSVVNKNFRNSKEQGPEFHPGWMS